MLMMVISYVFYVDISQKTDIHCRFRQQMEVAAEVVMRNGVRLMKMPHLLRKAQTRINYLITSQCR